MLLFAVFALLALMVGGSAHIDAGGACCLFVFGGLLGLLVLAIYGKGKDAAYNETHRARGVDRRSEFDDFHNGDFDNDNDFDGFDGFDD